MNAGSCSKPAKMTKLSKSNPKANVQTLIEPAIRIQIRTKSVIVHKEWILRIVTYVCPDSGLIPVSAVWIVAVPLWDPLKESVTNIPENVNVNPVFPETSVKFVRMAPKHFWTDALIVSIVILTREMKL